MGFYPSAIAGYEAALQLLEGTGVRVKDPRVMSVISDDPLTMCASFPPAYSVDAVPLPEGINMCRQGRYGFGTEYRMVDYPVAHDHPDFTAELKRVLMPVVEEFLAKAAADETAQRAADPTGVHESYEAIREVK